MRISPFGFERASRREIVEEFVRMCADEKSRIGRLVFGNRRAFLNGENVQPYRTLCDPNGYDLRRRITVSTVDSLKP